MRIGKGGDAGEALTVAAEGARPQVSSDRRGGSQTRPTLVQKLLNACSMFRASRARPFPAHHARHWPAIMVLSMLQPAARLRSRQCWSNSIPPDAGKARATVSAVPSRRAFRPTFGRSSSALVERLPSRGFSSQAIVTLATVRPILFGVAV